MKKIIVAIALICLCRLSYGQNRVLVRNDSLYEAITKDMLLGKNINLKDGRWLCKDDKYLLKEVYAAFDKMREAAARDGLTIKVRSGLRTFNHQTWIWNWKWGLKERASMSVKERALDILKYSSMPGTSRHHWGAEIDITSLELKYWASEEGKAVYQWLCNNAERFGFFQPFTHSRDKGYLVEQWHWSYFPISDTYYIKYLETITYDDLKGFEGCEVARDIKVIERWVQLGNER